MQRTTFISAFVGSVFAAFFFGCYVVFTGHTKTIDVHTLISSLQRNKSFVMKSSAQDTSSEDEFLPAKIIHQSWKTHNLPQRFKKWRASWKKCFPNWEMKLWNDTENRKFIFDHYPWFIKYYDNFTWHIHRVDSVRYFYLFHYGGLYTDLDNECLKPFPHLLQNYSLVFGAMSGQFASFVKEGYVQNSFMYSRPRHPFWLEMIHEIINRRKSSARPEAIAGPITLVHSINMYRKRHTRDIKIYPPQYFNPNNWLKARKDGCKDFNQMSEEDEKRCKAAHKDAFVIQYHTQTWGRGTVTRRRL